MKTMIKLATFAALLSLASVADAQVRWGFGIYVGTPPPPPPPRREIVCAQPYPDAYWTAGYWNFDRFHRRYAWVPGRWERREMRHDWREDRREDRWEDHRDFRRDDHGEHRGWDRHDDHGYDRHYRD